MAVKTSEATEAQLPAAAPFSEQPRWDRIHPDVRAQVLLPNSDLANATASSGNKPGRHRDSARANPALEFLETRLVVPCVDCPSAIAPFGGKA